MVIKSRKEGSTRVDAVYQQLRGLAYSRGPEAKMPTVAEMQQQFGASQATIVGALDALEDQRIVYRRHRHGIFVSPKLHRKRIHILMDSQWLHAGSSPFWGQLFGLLAEGARDRSATRDEDYTFQLVTPWQDTSEPLPDNLRQKIDDGLIHGVIAIGLGVIEASWFIQSTLPLVSFAGAGYWAVEFDQERFMELGIGALAERGCRRIAKIRTRPTGSAHMPNPEADKAEDEIFFRQLRAWGIDDEGCMLVDYGAIKTGDAVPPYQRQGLEIATHLFAGGDTRGIDGLLITDDMLTSGLLVGLSECGIVPCDRLAIATHANAGSPILFGSKDHIVLIEFDPAEIAHALFSMLDALIAGRAPDERYRVITPRRRDGILPHPTSLIPEVP